MKFYCINLDKRKIKWERFKKQFSLIEKEENLTRVAGIDFGGGDNKITRGACSAAHCIAIDTALQSGEDIFTIFEDDIFFYDHTVPLVSKCLNYLQDKDWHLLYWGCVPREEATDTPLMKTDEDFILKVMCAGAAHAITYKRSFATEYIKNFPKNLNRETWIQWADENTCHDVFLRRYQKEGKSYIPNKLCACQYNGYSDIDQFQSDRQDVIESQFKRYK